MAQPIWTVPFYDLRNEKTHVTTIYGSILSSFPLTEDVRAVVTRPALPVDNMFFTVIYDSTSPGVICQYTKPVSTIADFINGWNVQATQSMVKHELIMDFAYTEANVESDGLVRLTNMSQHTIHLFANSHNYIGCWTPYESLHIPITSFVTTTPIMSISDPIVVMHDRLVFQLTAYIYKKKQQGDFIVLNEEVVIPVGFYKNMTDLIAHMNKNIKMRGERNGFIYHFIQGKNGRMGIESSHRQPDPSFLLIKPTSCVLGMWENEPHTLYLRTNKKYMFEDTIARVIF